MLQSKIEPFVVCVCVCSVHVVIVHSCHLKCYLVVQFFFTLEADWLAYGGSPSNISIALIPRLHISALQSYTFPNVNVVVSKAGNKKLMQGYIEKILLNIYTYIYIHV